MVSLLICLVLLHAAALNEANVLLNSSIGGGRRFACDGAEVTFTCQVFESDSFEWRNRLIDSIAFASDDPVPLSVPSGPFLATLISIEGRNTLSANFTSTLQVNASRMILPPNTTVECSSEELSFTVTAIPEAPANLTIDEITRARGNVTITASWTNSPNFQQFEIDRYDINVTSTSDIWYMTMANGTDTNITLSVDEDAMITEPTTTFTLTIAAVNLCGETGSVASTTDTLTMPTTTNPTTTSTISPTINLPAIIGGVVGGVVGGVLAVITIIIISILIYYRCCKKEKIHHGNIGLQKRA